MNLSSSALGLLQRWVVEFATDSGRARDDIHIDQLDARLRSDRMWIEGAQLVLAAARAVQESERLPVTIAVEIFLADATTPAQPQLRGVPELLSLGVSWTPPALVAYKRGGEPWVADASFYRLEIPSGTEWGRGAQAFFQEWYDTAEESYDRRLWIVI